MGDPVLDVDTRPDATALEVRHRGREVRVVPGETIDLLPRHPEQVRELRDAEQVLRHARTLFARVPTENVSVDTCCYST